MKYTFRNPHHEFETSLKIIKSIWQLTQSTRLTATAIRPVHRYTISPKPPAPIAPSQDIGHCEPNPEPVTEPCLPTQKPIEAIIA